MSKIIDKLLFYREQPGSCKILVNISWLFIDRIVRMGFGLVVAIWTARYLGKEQFGVLNYGYGLCCFVRFIRKSGLGRIASSAISKRSISAFFDTRNVLLDAFCGWMAILAHCSGGYIRAPS
jgi:Polysaccharide biosynthesis protein